MVFEITVGADDEGKPTLKWAPVGAESYAVYRATTVDGQYKSVFTTKGRTYTHISAVAGNTYYYKLKAVMADGTYTKMYTTTGTSYTNTSAVEGKTYYYKVEVIFEDGTSKISDPVKNGFN